MRRPRQHKVFEVSQYPGLSNYLSGINSDGEDSSPNILSYIKDVLLSNSNILLFWYLTNIGKLFLEYPPKISILFIISPT